MNSIFSRKYEKGHILCVSTLMPTLNDFVQIIEDVTKSIPFHSMRKFERNRSIVSSDGRKRTNFGSLARKRSTFSVREQKQSTLSSTLNDFIQIIGNVTKHTPFHAKT